MPPFDELSAIVRFACPKCGQAGVTQGVRAEPGRVMLLRRCAHCLHYWETERSDATRGISGLRADDRRNGAWSHARLPTVQQPYQDAEE